MAIRASELLLIVRAQNQASGALRRIAGDVRGLGRLQELQMRRNQLAINQGNIMRQRQRALNELESIQTGSRAIGRKQQALSLATKQAAIDFRRNSILTKQAGISNVVNTAQNRLHKLGTQQLRLTEKLAEAERAYQDTVRMRKNLQARQRRGGIDPSMMIPLEEVQAKKFERNMLLRDLEQVRLDTVATQRAMQGASRDSRVLGERFATTASQAAALSLAHQRLAADTAKDAARANILQSELATASQRLAQNQRQVKLLNNEIRRARWEPIAAGGRIMQHTARVVQMGGLVVTASLGLMAHSAANWQTEVALAATQTRKAGQSFQATARNSEYLQSRILKLMKQFPASSQEMSSAAYDIYSSLNISLPGGVKLLKLFNQAAVAGQTSLDEVAGAAITVMNDFRIGVPGMTKAFQTMFAAVRYGRMTFGQFVAMMPQLSPAFSAAGFGLNEMAKAAAFMTRVMPNTRMAATSLARLTEMFGRKDFIAGAEKMGAKITDVHNRLLPMPKIIDVLIKKFPQIARAAKSGKGDVELQNFFKEVTALGSGKAGTTGTIQGRRAMIFMVTQAKLMRQIYKDVGADRNEFTMSLRAMEKTTGVKWGVFINQLKALALEIGVAVIPAFLEFGALLQRLVKWWHSIDEPMRNQILHWAAYGGAIALVASAVLVVAGAFVRLVATLGGGGRLLSGGFAIFAAAAITIGILTGRVHNLGDALNSIGGMISHFGWMGWAATFGLATVGVLRLTGAMRSLAGAYRGVAVAEGASGVAGILGRSGRGARNLRAGLSLSRDAIKTQGVMRGLAASAMLVPGPLWIAGAAIAAAGAGTLLWKRHIDRVRAAAEQARREMEAMQKVQDAPVNAARRLGGLAVTARNLIQLRAELSQTQKSLKTAKGPERTLLQVQRADTLDQIAAATDRANKQFDKLSLSVDKAAISYNAMERSASRLGKLRALQQVIDRIRDSPGDSRLAGLQRQRIDMSRALGIDPNLMSRSSQVAKAIRVTETNLQRFASNSRRYATQLSGSFNAVVTGFTRLGKLPQLSGRIRDQMLGFAVKIGRMLTLPEMQRFAKLAIRAELDPRSISRVKGQMAFFIRNMQRQSMIENAKQSVVSIKPNAPQIKGLLKYPFGKSPLQLLTSVKKPTNAGAVKRGVADIFKKRIPQPIHIGPVRPNAHSVGLAISQGIARGVSDGTGWITDAANAAAESAMAAAKATIEAHSPSRRAAREIGQPFSQGIALGILQKRGDIVKAANLALDIFQGAFLSSRDVPDPLKLARAQHSLTIAQAALKKHETEANRQRVDIARKRLGKMKPITAEDLTKDLRGQLMAFRKFNNAIATLGRRHVPRGLLDDLRALGAEGASKIAVLSRMSAPELRKYVALWKKAQKEIKASQTLSQTDLNTAMKSLKDEAAQNLLTMWNEFHSTNEQNFGQLFDGLSDKVGDSFKQAMDQYESDRKSLVDELANLNKQVHDALQAQLGDLFQGDFLASHNVQSRLDWGQLLGFDDLFQDLEGQVTKFENWSSNLKQLAGKVPPGLAQALAALGPDAADKLDILNNATSEQLKSYVDLWLKGQADLQGVSTNGLFNIDELLKQIDEVKAKLAELKAPHELTAEEVVASIQKQIAAWNEYQGLLQNLVNQGVPLELVQQLQQMGPEAVPYLRALVNNTSGQLGAFVQAWRTAHDAINTATNVMMNTQLQIWYTHGANIAAQIIAGVASEQDALLAFFRNLFSGLLTGNLPKLPTAPILPGTIMPVGQLPNNSATGPGGPPVLPGEHGTSGGVDPYGVNSNTLLRNLEQASTPAPVVNNYNEIKVDVVAHQDETLDAALARATFRMFKYMKD